MGWGTPVVGLGTPRLPGGWEPGCPPPGYMLVLLEITQVMPSYNHE